MVFIIKEVVKKKEFIQDVENKGIILKIVTKNGAMIQLKALKKLK